MDRISHGRVGPVEWAVAERSYPGEHESGDGWAVATADETTLLAAIDGLGHGNLAAVAARRAEAVLREHCTESLDALFTRCHRALADTRGAAITLGHIDRSAACMTWLGVGNVAASLVRSSPGDPTVVAHAMLRGGVVGQQLPDPLRGQRIALQPGDLLLFGTDGLAADFDQRPDLGVPPAALAQDILMRSATGSDDALILVGRYRGPTR